MNIQSTLNNTTPAKHQMRYAMLSFFLAQGLCFSSWASRIPDVKNLFDVDTVFYWGIILFFIPVGKFVAIPLSGYLVSKFGSKRISQVAILGYASSLLTIGISTEISHFIGSGWLNLILLGLFLFSFGIFWNMCDISLNAQAIEIERLYGKTIMASFHGGWSLAACLGALIGFIMILFDISPLTHFVLIFFIISGSTLYCRKYLIEEFGKIEEKKEEQKENKTNYIFHPEKLLLQLGLVGLFALIVESAMFDWSGIYFESVLKVPKTMQFGFLVFMIMMTMGRFLTNSAYRLLGKKGVLQAGGILIFGGFFIAALGSDFFNGLVLKVIINSLGFMMVGLGISCMVPTLYSFVGAQSKTPLGIALSILSSISFIGSLIAPLMIGSISQAIDIKFAYLCIGILGLLIFIIVSTASEFNKKENQ